MCPNTNDTNGLWAQGLYSTVQNIIEAVGIDIALIMCCYLPNLPDIDILLTAESDRCTETETGIGKKTDLSCL